jgi:Tol biopolymer transport system component
VGLFVVLLSASSSSAARMGRMELGFVRGPSVFLAASDGTHVRPVLRGRGNTSYFGPAWSSGGRLSAAREIYGQGGSAHAEYAVIVARRDRAPIVVEGSGRDVSPTWAPDGKRIAFIGNASQFGGTLSVGGLSLPGMPLPGSECCDSDDEPAWSPDGKSIAFTRGVYARDGTRNYAGFYLFVVDAEGGRARQVMPTPASNPSWSPDSRRLVFDDSHHIKVINVDGSGLRTLFTARQGDDAYNPAWSPDGRLIAFDYGGPNGDRIWTMRANGSHPHLVIRNARDPAWKRG